MKFFIPLALILSFSAMAAGPQLDNLSKKDVEEISKEFGANFSHTVASAPQTNGLFGIDVGIIVGQTTSEKFKGLIEDSGGNGSDFGKLLHAGLGARVHVPFEVFAEVNVLPEQTINELSIKNTSYAFGWNFGRYMSWPLDFAIGAERGSAGISFKQTSPSSTVGLDTTTSNYWIGVSKTFLLITPYVKLGASSIDGELTAATDVFDDARTSRSVSTSGGLLTVGASANLLLVKVGLEYSQIQDVKRVSARLSFGF